MSKDNLIFPISPVKAAPVHVDALTINWHVTEACNYRCQYCYAKWTDQPCPRELFHDRDRSQNQLPVDVQRRQSLIEDPDEDGERSRLRGHCQKSRDRGRRADVDIWRPDVERNRCHLEE